MEKNIFKGITIKALFLLVMTPAILKAQPAVDGFLKGKSNLDVAIGATYENFNQYYWKSNELTGLGRSSIAASVFGAMGITNWLDAQVNIPYISTSGSFSNMQDLSGYFKGAVLNKYSEKGNNLRILLVAGGSVPMSDYETEGLYAIGQQATTVEGRLVAQVTLSNGFFIMAQGGLANRNDPVPSSSVAAMKFGWAKANYYVDLWYDQQIADGGKDYFDFVEDSKNNNGETDITFRDFGVSYGKVGATYYRPIGESSGLAFGASYIIWGRNVGQSIGFSASFIKRFSFNKE